MIGSTRTRLLIALAFLLPNLLGFLVFTAGPVLFSAYMSFTDWSLAEHNTATGATPEFIGFENYRRLLVGDEAHLFWDYFWNTVYLMIGIPLGIAGSLILAIMLNIRCEPTTRSGRFRAAAIAIGATVVATIGVWMLTSPGAAPDPSSPAFETLSTETGLGTMRAYDVALTRSHAAIAATLVLGAVVTMGLLFGTIFFRTIYYLPTLLAGVAMYLLWKTIYRPDGGLINAGLAPVLSTVESIVRATPAWLWYAIGAAVLAVCVGAALRLVLSGVRKLGAGEVGGAAFAARLCIAITLAGAGLGLGWVSAQLPERSLFATGWSGLSAEDLSEIRGEILRDIPGADRGSLDIIVDQLGSNIHPRAATQIFSSAVARTPADEALIREMAFSRSAPVKRGYVAGDGLRAPAWLQSETWAKPAIILMGVWLGIGGGNMLLYLAGLSNVPPELYEAAAIDGATGWQRFAHVTWPQLAPTTFFIVIMSTIGGLQGGFEQVMIMTEGKYDTIVLTYYQYIVAFKDRADLGLACAIAWIMFAMIFVMTAVNFRVGSRMTNE